MADVSPAPGGRTILGLRPRTALIAGGVILAAALGYMLWRRRQSSSSQPAAASSSAAGGYGVDYGGELSTIQSELEDLLAAEGNEPSGGGGGTGGGGTGGGSTGHDCPGGFTWDPVQGKCVPGLGEQGTGGGGGGGGTGTKTKSPPGMPASVRASRVTSNAVTLQWTKAPNATSYRVRATYQGKAVGSQQTVNGTSATVSGLHPDHTYTFHVASIGPGGTSSETNGPIARTTR